MASKQMTIVVSADQESTRPDVLSTDCLRVECSPRINVGPGVTSRINLTLHNTSPIGRMGHVSAKYNNKVIEVLIPNSLAYIGPDSKTVIYAIITPLVASGSSTVVFDIT